jgi:hypothetical protein
LNFKNEKLIHLFQFTEFKKIFEKKERYYKNSHIVSLKIISIWNSFFQRNHFSRDIFNILYFKSKNWSRLFWFWNNFFFILTNILHQKGFVKCVLFSFHFEGIMIFPKRAPRKLLNARYANSMNFCIFLHNSSFHNSNFLDT